MQKLSGSIRHTISMTSLKTSNMNGRGGGRCVVGAAGSWEMLEVGIVVDGGGKGIGRGSG